MLNQGDRTSVEIIDLGTGGEGIGRVEGMAVFVSGTVPGDVALVEITQVKKSFARGEAVELETMSPWRIEPVCPHAQECGGCSMQHVSYEGQLAIKRKWVEDRLTRIGGIAQPNVLPTLGMETDSAGLDNEGKSGAETDGPWRYRNKALFPVGRVSGADKKVRGCNIGFYKEKSHEIVNCKTCLLQTEAAEAVAQVIRQYVKEQKVPVYDKKTGTGVLRNVLVRTAFGSGEVMVVLIATERRMPGLDKLVEQLDTRLKVLSADLNARMKAVMGTEADTEEDEDYGYYLESVILNVNKKKTGELFSSHSVTLAGKPTITDYICGMEFEISASSFYQVNPVQTEKLYEKVREFAGLTGKETVLDLYCGVGTIGLYLAKHAKKVIGVETSKYSVMDANRNAVINGIINAEYLCGKAEEVLPKLVEEGFSGSALEADGEKLSADVVILDPPRAGCERPLLDAVMAVKPERIVYVSCDPATLARDVKVLSEEGGYELKEVQPVDMFPWTGHVEVVIQMTFCGSDKKNKG